MYPSIYNRGSRGGQKGIALLLVLSSLLILSAIVVEFAYDTNVSYNVSINEEERLKAHYLALSGLNFAKIVIRYDKDAKQLVASAARQLGRNIQVQPLYKMMPINSALLRGLMESATSEGGEGIPPPPEGGEGEDKFGAARQGMASLNLKEAKNFLDFQGDFSAEVEPEDGKIPLNAFYQLNSTAPEYDRLKNVLVQLFLQKSFEGLLKDKTRDSQDLANKIADYVDKNDSVNEAGGNERGPEMSQYSGTSLRPKNAKFLTIEELMLVPGMTDDLLTELKKHVTVYKSTDKINACAATDEVLRAMIIAFTMSREDIEDIRPENEDRLKNAVEKVREKCPDTGAMGQALNEVLGLAGPGSAASVSPTTQPSGPGGTPPPPATSFASMLTNEETIFRIEAIGTVGNAEVKIVDVINSASPNPDQWRDLYWRVE